ncbi:unnamed protein product [Cuscuta campestris]|uniref:Auxin-responsive protein n=1 Tax=Cuscuta campestris TaxID=132261 RepID=A0A484MBS7_9ASTE|nr:unnamed protein product [Cuscuta campestris]
MGSMMGGVGHRGLNLKATELCLGLPGGGGGGESEPGNKITGKRGFSETVVDLKLNLHHQSPAASNSSSSNNSVVMDLKEKTKSPPMESNKDPIKPPSKAQVVGWPPVRNYRKNVMANQKSSEEVAEEKGGGGGGAAAFVKVCMDGAPYLRKVDLKMYESYKQLSHSLAKMFSSFTMPPGNNNNDKGGMMIDFMNEGKVVMDDDDVVKYVPTYEDKDGDWMLVGDVPWEMFVNSCKRLRIMKGSEAIGLAPRAMEKCKRRS